MPCDMYISPHYEKRYVFYIKKRHPLRHFERIIDSRNIVYYETSLVWSVQIVATGGKFFLHSLPLSSVFSIKIFNFIGWHLFCTLLYQCCLDFCRFYNIRLGSTSLNYPISHLKWTSFNVQKIDSNNETHKRTSS